MLKARLELSEIALKYKLILETVIGSNTFIPSYTLNGKVQIGDKEYRATYNDISKGLTEYVLAYYTNLKDEIDNFKVDYPYYQKNLDTRIIDLNKPYIKMPEDYFNE